MTNSPVCTTTGRSRREVLRAGLTGFTGMSLATVNRLRAAAADDATNPSEKTAVILVWLRGGCSHLDTFDPKPDAPSEYRGPFLPIHTRVPGMQLTELLPRLAQCSHQYSLLRSVAHDAGGHPAGSLRVLSGDPDRADKPQPVLPDWMSIASWQRHNSGRLIPGYVAVNPVDRYDSFVIAGSSYLGPAWEPFRVTGDPAHPDFQVPNIGMNNSQQANRLLQRSQLSARLDHLRRDLDQSGVMEAVDRFDSQALNLLTSPEAREAFDLSREPDSMRDHYGRHQWGQQCLMARRLVEAGVDVVATEFDGPLCGRVANWDDHAVNHHVFDAISYRAPFFDQAVSTLINDVYDRGLAKRVLVVVTGEFGRTPRISYVASSGGGVASGAKGTIQPGRDHWPRANTMLFAGGGIRTGQVIGATDRVGEDAIERRVSPQDFLATIYRHLGIDYENTSIVNFSGRPVPILTNGRAIAELGRVS
ncbi:MAG: DUF1501 domain-containing protein [Planctomycetaceae bacterium]